jgi:type I restriction enzyme S subunit
VIRVHYGSALKANERVKNGRFEVFGSSGLIGCHDAALIDRPTIVIGRKGSVGAVTLANRGGWIIDTAFFVELIEPGKCDLRYFYYALAAANLAQHTITTSIPGLSRDDIYRTRVAVPSLDEQRRIADILDKADSIRRKRKEAIALTEELLRSAFLEMFGDPVSNPKGWEVRRLGDLLLPGESINYGVVQPGDDVENGVQIVRVGDFDGLRIDPLRLKRIRPEIEAQHSRSRLRGDEVLIACVGTIGKVALADPGLLGANIARAVARVRVGALVDRQFVAHFLTMPFAQSFFASETRTVSQPTLNIKQIAQTPIVVAPMKLQKDFAEFARRVARVSCVQESSTLDVNALFHTIVSNSFN